jgi:hypothetical protein
MSTAMMKTRNAWSVGLMCVLVAGGVASCAGSSFKKGIYTDPELGYSIPDPNAHDEAVGPRWSRTSIKGTDLAYRGPDHAFLALSSHCDEDESRPNVLGRQLLVGLKNRRMISNEAFEFADGQAFRQSVESKDEDGDVIFMQTVTLVREGCVVDWMLVENRAVPEVVSSFDRWWRAFMPGEMPKASSDLPEVTP